MEKAKKLSGFLLFVIVCLGMPIGSLAQYEQTWLREVVDDVGRDTYVEDVFVDTNNFVYVTGHVRIEIDEEYKVCDYVTAKYFRDGSVDWIVRYDGPVNGRDWGRAITVDRLGYVYVTGGSEGNGTDRDYATIKYSPEGEELWVARWHSTAVCGRYPQGLPGTDEACDVEVDAEGNVYVTGRSSILKNGMYPLYAGSCYSPADYVTIKYSPEGEELWVQRFDGPSHGRDEPRELALDSNRNIYVTGTSSGRRLPQGTSSSDDMDFATVKYSPGGEELWVARWDGPSKRCDSASNIAIDGENNVIVFGRSYPFALATVKYNSAGEELWVSTYRSRRGEIQIGSRNSLVVDAEGNIFVTCSSDNPDDPDLLDYTTIRYDRRGVEQWVRRYRSDESGVKSKASSIALDPEGNVIVTGRLWNPALARHRDIHTIKYNPEGEILWLGKFIGSPLAKHYSAVLIAVDSPGNLYIAAPSLWEPGPVFNSESVLLRFTPVAPFLRGDVDSSGNANLTDGIALLNYLFLRGSEPSCLDAGDIDDNATLDITDAVRLLQYLFQSGEPPPPPGLEECGYDATRDELVCRLFDGCPE